MKTIKLQPNETYSERYADWTIVAQGDIRGILVIREARSKGKKEKESRYLVKEYARRQFGRGFQLRKPGGEEQYNVEIVVTTHDLCDCTGFLQHGRCKHTLALRELVRAGLVLDGPETAELQLTRPESLPMKSGR